MPATPVKIGPFSGGLNSFSGPTSISDNECSDILNLDLDLDGSLVSRPPITAKGVPADYPAVDGYLKPLTWFVNASMDRYLIVAVDSPTGGTYAYNEGTGVWTLITSTFVATAAIQYDNKVWLVADPAETDPGGSWSPTGGFTPVAAMVKGSIVCIYKERLFIGGSTANVNRIYFSNAADFTTWQISINFFDVRAGDGENVTAITTFQDTVVIFKSDSTYVYSYDSNPSRGSVRLINGSIGCTNKNCLVEYDNSLYIHYKDKAYQVANWNFTLINLKVPFEYSVTIPGLTYNSPSISIMADRLVIRHYDTVYVFNLRIGVWTKWSTNEAVAFNYFIEVPRNTAADPLRYYAGCRNDNMAANNRVLFEWYPESNTSRSEEMTCYVVTKVYDFNVPYTFKRLFWWGADVLTKRDLNYTVHPVVFSRTVTHQEMAAFAHVNITGNHLRPLDISIDVTGTLNISNITSLRMFVKLIKSLRFRQIYFTVGGTTDGTTIQGPIRIYSLSAFVDNKQLVPSQVS